MNTYNDEVAVGSKKASLISGVALTALMTACGSLPEKPYDTRQVNDSIELSHHSFESIEKPLTLPVPNESLRSALRYGDSLLTEIIDAQLSRPGIFMRMDSQIAAGISKDLALISNSLNTAMPRNNDLSTNNLEKVQELSATKVQLSTLAKSLTTQNIASFWATESSAGVSLVREARQTFNRISNLEYGVDSSAYSGTPEQLNRTNNISRTEQEVESTFATLYYVPKNKYQATVAPKPLVETVLVTTTAKEKPIESMVGPIIPATITAQAVSKQRFLQDITATSKQVQIEPAKEKSFWDTVVEIADFCANVVVVSGSLWYVWVVFL